MLIRNPRLAREVVTGLVNIFMERATSSNRGEMENAQRFLNEQIALYEGQLRTAEQRRADFRRRYLEILPLDGGVSRLESERAGLRELEAQLRDTMAKRTALQEQARITPPQIAARVVGGAVVRDGAGRRSTDLRRRKPSFGPNI